MKIEAMMGATVPDASILRIRPSRGWRHLNLQELWEYRELLYYLIWRDLKVRYKQTAIGVSWVVLQPLVTMLLFTAIFGYMAKVPSDGVWYPVFSLTALLPWTYFAQAITRSGESVVGNAKLVGKIYFPRLLLPLCNVHMLLFGLLMYAGIRPPGK